jgi:hypothetical protein
MDSGLPHAYSLSELVEAEKSGLIRSMWSWVWVWLWLWLRLRLPRTAPQLCLLHDMQCMSLGCSHCCMAALARHGQAVEHAGGDVARHPPPPHTQMGCCRVSHASDSRWEGNYCTWVLHSCLRLGRLIGS